jgi:hypothetical protein
MIYNYFSFDNSPKPNIMRTNIFILFLFFCILGCTSKQSDQLTQKQKDQIKKEVMVVFDSTNARFGRMDAIGASQYFSPEFVEVWDTALAPLETARKGWIAYFDTFAKVKWTTANIECIVLTKDLVIITWIGKMESLKKTGEKITIDPEDLTYIYKKVDGQWKAIYVHSSGTRLKEKA